MEKKETRLKSERNELYKVGSKKGAVKREQNFKGTKLGYMCLGACVHYSLGAGHSSEFVC